MVRLVSKSNHRFDSNFASNEAKIERGGVGRGREGGEEGGREKD
jgi:hypothetical protein